MPRIRRSCCPVSKMFGRPSVARNLRDIATEPETEEGRLGHIGVATGPRRHLVDLRLPRSESPACWLMCLFSHPFGLRGRTVGSPAAQRPRRRRPHQRSTTERTWPSTPQRRSSSSSRQALNPTRGEPEPCMQSCTRANSMKSAPTVRLVFDGAGTAWLARWRSADGASSRAGSLFAELAKQGLAYEVCDYCAGAFDLKEDLLEAGEALAGAYMDHPSVAARVAEGFAVWILLAPGKRTDRDRPRAGDRGARLRRIGEALPRPVRGDRRGSGQLGRRGSVGPDRAILLRPPPPRGGAVHPGQGLFGRRAGPAVRDTSDRPGSPPKPSRNSARIWIDSRSSTRQSRAHHDRPLKELQPQFGPRQPDLGGSTAEESARPEFRLRST